MIYENNDKQKATYGIMIYVLIMYVFSNVIALFLANYYSKLIPFISIQEQYQALANFIIYIFLFIPLIYIFLEVLITDLKDFFKHFFKNISLIVYGYFILIIFSNVAQMILNLLNSEPAQNQATIEQILSGGYILPMAIMTVILAPICEELIFRKSIYSFFKNDTISLWVSSLTFGLIHVLQGDFINIISYASSGLAFGIVYNKSNRNIFVTILLHSLSNLLSLMVLLLI